jgi:hypothetical protein
MINGKAKKICGPGIEIYKPQAGLRFDGDAELSDRGDEPDCSENQREAGERGRLGQVAPCYGGAFVGLGRMDLHELKPVEGGDQRRERRQQIQSCDCLRPGHARLVAYAAKGVKIAPRARNGKTRADFRFSEPRS